MAPKKWSYEGATFEGKGKTLEEAIDRAAAQAIARQTGPLQLRLVDLRITVENPITEYRAIFIPTG